MANIIEGDLSAKGKKIAIIAGRFNDFITNKLVSGAIDALTRSGADENNIDIIKVPGAFEIPLIAKTVSENKKYNAIICLGAVIRGATPHFDFVSNEVAKGVAQAGMEAKIPIIFGVLTTDSIEQAIERAGAKSGNKGFEAAMAAIEMSNLMNKMA